MPTPEDDIGAQIVNPAPQSAWIIRETTTGSNSFSPQWTSPNEQGSYTSPTQAELQVLLRSMQSANSDPIKFNNNSLSIDRQGSPEKPLYLYFEADAIKIYEEDAQGHRHLRCIISYDKINSLMVVNQNEMLTAKEVAGLDQTVELRNTQASLLETATQLRQLKELNGILQSKEISKLNAEKHVFQEQIKLLHANIKKQEQDMQLLEVELLAIKKQVADRKKVIDCFELD